MVNKNPIPDFSLQRGIMLVEGLIAVLVLSVGVLGLVGLQASMIKATADAKYRAEASFVAQQRLGMLWADRDNLPAYAVDEPGADLSQNSSLPSGRVITVFGTEECNFDPRCVIVRVKWQVPGTDEQRSVTNIGYIS